MRQTSLLPLFEGLFCVPLFGCQRPRWVRFIRFDGRRGDVSDKSFCQGVPEHGDSGAVFQAVDPSVVGQIEKKLQVLPFVVKDDQDIVRHRRESARLPYAVLAALTFSPGFTGAGEGFP